MNNFKDYGFEADFEGEILKEVDGRFVGYVTQKYDVPVFSGYWDSQGNFTSGRIKYREYNLKPITQKWYEDEDVIGKMVWCFDLCRIAEVDRIAGDKVFIKGGGYYLIKDVRPATKEEVLSLYYETKTPTTPL